LEGEPVCIIAEVAEASGSQGGFQTRHYLFMVMMGSFDMSVTSAPQTHSNDEDNDHSHKKEDPEQVSRKEPAVSFSANIDVYVFILSKCDCVPEKKVEP
jgi:hypothetical protein